MPSFSKVFYVVVSWPVHVRHPAARKGMKIESAWDTHAEAVKRYGQIVDGPAEGAYSETNPLGDSNAEVMTYVDLHTRGIDPKKRGNWLKPGSISYEDPPLTHFQRGLEGVSKSQKIRSLDPFTRAYIEAALWSSNDESDESGGVPIDQNYDMNDLTVAALDAMIEDSQKFQRENAELLAQAGDDAQNGHDFWLTRNHHGAGFWDRDYDEVVGKKLTDAAHAYGEVHLYVQRGKVGIE